MAEEAGHARPAPSLLLQPTRRDAPAQATAAPKALAVAAGKAVGEPVAGVAGLARRRRARRGLQARAAAAAAEAVDVVADVRALLRRAEVADGTPQAGAVLSVGALRPAEPVRAVARVPLAMRAVAAARRIRVGLHGLGRLDARLCALGVAPLAACPRAVEERAARQVVAVGAELLPAPPKNRHLRAAPQARLLGGAGPDRPRAPPLTGTHAHRCNGGRRGSRPTT